ncbi:MAG: HEPN domain-containing protein [Patescibacteria group bacterium]|jgi:HEPN domain-containing protein
MILEEQINYWRQSAERNWKTSLDLFKTKHYDASLFYAHLAIEKII